VNFRSSLAKDPRAQHQLPPGFVQQLAGASPCCGHPGCSRGADHVEHDDEADRHRSTRHVCTDPYGCFRFVRSVLSLACARLADEEGAVVEALCDQADRDLSERVPEKGFDLRFWNGKWHDGNLIPAWAGVIHPLQGVRMLRAVDGVDGRCSATVDA
jgi:hypothetical protein